VVLLAIENEDDRYDVVLLSRDERELDLIPAEALLGVVEEEGRIGSVGTPEGA